MFQIILKCSLNGSTVLSVSYFIGGKKKTNLFFVYEFEGLAQPAHAVVRGDLIKVRLGQLE